MGLYAIVKYILAARIVVDVDGNTTQGRNFGGELGETGVVLSMRKSANQ